MADESQMNLHPDRIDLLERRVDRIEDEIRKHLQRIFENLEELKVSSARTACPSPGACGSLGNDLAHAIRAHDATMMRVERLELKLIDLEREATKEAIKIQQEFNKIYVAKAWLLGVWSAIAFCASILGAGLAIWINHMFK